MEDLFSAAGRALAPLADRMRPRTLEEFIGQRQIVGKGKLLRRAIEADRLTSSIFWGPPGCGKTTLASIIAGSTQAAFVKLNAVTSGVADVREVLKEAQERLKLYGQSTYLLLDECHRWSKSQADAIPVSYTHLDVDKRQNLYNTKRCCRSFFGGSAFLGNGGGMEGV